MTKKERIAELERKVAELEARPTTIIQREFYAPAFDANRCHVCGAYGWHACMGRWWDRFGTGGWTVSVPYSTVATTDYISNITYLGATG